MPREARGRGPGWLDAVAGVHAFLSVILFGGLTVVVALQVLTRFVLHVPFLWSEEAARFLFFWVVLLGSASSVRTGRHFVIDVTMGRTRRLSPRARAVFDAVPGVLVLLYSGFLLVQGIAYARVGLLRTATNSGLNMGVVYAAIPVFAALSMLYAASALVIGARRHGADPEDGGDSGYGGDEAGAGGRGVAGGGAV